jgi:hypothetical protein
MEHYFGDAEKEGISAKEIEAIQSIVMAVAAGKIRAQAGEARARKSKSE